MGDDRVAADPLGGNSQAQLKSFFERLENLADDATAIREDVKAVSAEMKAAGFKPAAVKKLVALRAKDKAKLLEDNAILDMYASALGVADLV